MRTPLNRRAVLRGAGVALGLPWLEAMTASSATATTVDSARPVRMAFVFFPNGAIMDAWRPSGDGAQFEFSQTLAPLAPFRDDLNILTGLAQDNGRAKGDGGGDHARCAASYLTGAHPVKTSGADIRAGISVDQLAAQAIGKHTLLPSLEVGVERGANAGNCDSGYSCAYSSNISWRTETTPMAKEVNPRAVFDRLFGEPSQSAANPRLDRIRRSILDLAAEDAKRLRARLGAGDRRKIDEYFSSLRDVEQRIRSAEMRSDPPPGAERPARRPDGFQDHVRLMYDLIALAFQTDSTRVASFMLANAGSNRSYPMVDVREGHHSISHHRNDQDKIEQLRRIDRYLVEEFARFLKRLKNTRDGEGSLLDHSMVLYGSGISDGNRHSHHDLPIVLAGRGGGAIQGGRVRAAAKETPLNNLFLSMLDVVGADVRGFGDSTGRVDLT